MIIGYARVSTREQNRDLQFDALIKAGCEKIFEESVSSRAVVRPEFSRLLETVRKGDVIVVWRINRLGRRTLELIKLMAELREKGVEFVSLIEGIDTRSVMGRVFFMISAVFAENELEVILENTRAGLESARARGKIGGRKKGLSKEAQEKAKVLKILYDAKTMSVDQIRKQLDIGSKATFYKYLEFEKNRLDEIV